MNAGIYTLVLCLDRPMDVEIGMLGSLHFREGYYCYTGSARGSGGLKRIERHKKVMQGVNLARRWHIDYLLPLTSLVDVVVTLTSADHECRIAGEIGSDLLVLPNFGSTDCRCKGHLHFSHDLDHILDVVRRAHNIIALSHVEPLRQKPPGQARTKEGYSP